MDYELKVIKELIDKLKQYSGDLPGEELPEDTDKFYFTTFEGANAEPGTKVWLYWYYDITGVFDSVVTDTGYMMYLPCMDDTDFHTIIHVPEPWSSKGEVEGEWVSLLSLIDNKCLMLVTDKKLTTEEYKEKVIGNILKYYPQEKD
jgi:hypothetical protein